MHWRKTKVTFVISSALAEGSHTFFIFSSPCVTFWLKFWQKKLPEGVMEKVGGKWKAKPLQW